MKDYAEKLLYANQAYEYVQRALRQEKRLQRAWRRMRLLDDELARVVEGSRFAPPRWVHADQDLGDQIYFLVLLLRQVVRGRELMEHLGFPMPEVRQTALITAWRDVAEHWDDPPKGRQLRAMRRWQELSDEIEPGLSRVGARRLRLASGLDIKWVRRDLRKLRHALSAVSAGEWDYCYLTPEEAAQLLGIAPGEVADLQPPVAHLDFEGDLGLRYWREAVEARLSGFDVPPRWVEEGWSGSISAR